MKRLKLFETEFARNVLTLVTGTTVAQAIPVAIAPLLTRLYAPDDFGVFALYASLTGLVSVAATGRYEGAIMLPERREEAANVLALSMMVSVLMSLFTLIIVVTFNTPITGLLGSPGIAAWLYLIPASVLFIGWYQSLNYWLNRRKDYKTLAASKVWQTGSASAGQLGMGWGGAGSGGLIISWVLGQLAGTLRLARQVRKDDRRLAAAVSREAMQKMARRYQDFPRYALAGSLINSMSYNVVNILISVFFNATVLGLYALVYRVLAMPSTIIGNAVAQVYFQQATEEKRTTGAIRKTFRKTLRKLTLIAIPVFIALFIAARYFFTFVFGDEWSEAGVYAQILLPFFFVRFISSTLSTTMTVFEQLKQALYVHSAIVLGNICVFSAAYVYEMSFRQFLYFYSAMLSILYAIFLYYYHYLSTGRSMEEGS